jgi:hypothetical protein
VTSNDGFSADEVGTGVRATLTPFDRAFLESPPADGEGDPALASTAPPPLMSQPPTARRVLSLLLFVGITGGAAVVLGLAALRALGHVFQ